MTVGEFVGSLAALLTFATFYMKTMLPLRIVGILSNVTFLTYAMIEDLVPILLLHGALLPLNLFRLYQILKLVREIREARTGDLALAVHDPATVQGGRDLVPQGRSLARDVLCP
jgi:CRP/FNR family transcriptional regulator, cyclic AMP receptor protein